MEFPMKKYCLNLGIVFAGASYNQISLTYKSEAKLRDTIQAYQNTKAYCLFHFKRSLKVMLINIH